MTIRTPSEELRSKALNRTQKTSIYALQSVRAKDDVRVLDTVAKMISYEFRPATITRLTGVPPTLVKKLYEREVVKPMTGRKPSSIGKHLARPQQHIEMTYLIEEFRVRYELDGREITALGFLGAWEAYYELANEKTRQTPEAGLALVDAWVEDQRKDASNAPSTAPSTAGATRMYLARCNTCHTHYLRSRTDIRIEHTFGFGDCPYCRSQQVVDTTRIWTTSLSEKDRKRAFENVMRKGFHRAK